MNDRFKFRAFYEGRYIYKDLCDSNYYTSENKCIGIANNLPNDLIWEQCTGLKDKNGKLIYEGDILGGLFGAPIAWCDNGKSFCLSFCGECMACSGDVMWAEVVESDDELEVIGNIHENPELLEEEV